MRGGNADYDFTCNLEVDYRDEANARIVYNALAVDEELRPGKVRRQMSVAADGKLSVRFEAVEARVLRASYSAFVDILTLASKTVEEFTAPPTY
ncbi:hypothetical protein M569_03806 [Genlisea aurea]|uniref:Uncharacterized protein n=1 Tax=Genlisea aurea TaxID=192259 RepID=S8CVV8_9LAMI|nr:hypothetical protein M569_03806 [Genlisea aurea]